MKITKAEDVQVGQWAALCCHCDLARIENEDMLQDIIGDMADEDQTNGLPWQVWETEREALLEIAQAWPEGSEERAECMRRAAALA